MIAMMLVPFFWLGDVVVRAFGWFLCSDGNRKMLQVYGHRICSNFLLGQMGRALLSIFGESSNMIETI